MSTIVRGCSDEAVDAIKATLDQYEQSHSEAVADVYRQNSASIRIRIVDPRFEVEPKGDRHDRVWDYLAERIDEDTLSQVSVLLLLAPKEQSASIMNMEFDDPTSSVLN